MGLDDTLWLTDTGDHTVKKCSLDGDVLLTLGKPGQPAPPLSGKPFNRCTHVAIHPDTEEVFVSDGYGNAAVHCFTADGRHQRSWGTPGNDPGHFNLPHNIAIDRDGYVYVADRHNSRIQVFTRNGRLEHIWYGMALPCGMHIDVTAPEQPCYLTELSSATWALSGPFASSTLGEIWNHPGMGPRVSVYSLDGRCLARLCDNGEGTELGQLVVPHGLTVDARGDIYVGMISWLAMGSLMDPPRQLRNVQKLERVATEI
jgi:DNA-binding beta-propeller fold protein YncE